MNMRRVADVLRLAGAVALPLLIPAAHFWPDTWGPLCIFRRLTGMRCPGCGMTSAICAAMCGNMAAALSHNCLVVVVLPLLALVWARAVFRALRRAFGGGREAAAKPAMLLVFAPIVLSCSCAPQPRPQPTFAQRISEAHGVDQWRRQDALAGDLHVEWGDGQTLNLSFLIDIKGGRTRMLLADGTGLLWDGQDVWVWPKDARPARPEHTLLMWPLLITLPMRLSDGDAVLASPQTRPLGARQCPTMGLSLKDRSGRVPDIPYIVYEDPEDHRLCATAFAMPGKWSLREGDDDPMAITFYGYENVDGVTFATEWRIFRWHGETGIYGRPIGSARVFNLEFVTPKKEKFVPPAGAVRWGQR